MRPFNFRKTSIAIAIAPTTVAAIFATALFGAPNAAADTKLVTVNTGSGNLNVRAAPSTQAELLGTIRNGSRFVITCYVHGAAFTGGPFGGTSDIWNKRQGGGYTTDRLLDTGSNEPVVPPCAGPDAPSAPPATAVSSRGSGKVG